MAGRAAWDRGWDRGKNREADAEGQFAHIGLRVGEATLVAGELGAEAGKIGRRLKLHPAGLGVLDFLQENHVGIMAADFRHRSIEIDRRMIGIRVVPDLPELHVELENAESAHGARLGVEPTDPPPAGVEAAVP